MEIRNRKLSDEVFFREREEVLAMWPTGKGVDLEEAVEYHKSLPPSKNAALKLLEGRKKGLLQETFSAGADTVAAHSQLVREVHDKAHVDVVASYIDSLTRNARFALAERGLSEALATGKKVLNGFPYVCHGVSGTRKITESVDIPLIVWGPGPDLRLVNEIGFAGGHSGYTGGPLITFWNYTKDVPVARIIQNFQYINRLMGYYEERGIPILYGTSGSMPCISPCSLMTSTKIIECLIAAEQGCKHILLCNWAQGNLAQDLASIITYSKLVHEYLEKGGYGDVATLSYSVNPTGRYPLDEAQVYAVISHFVLTAVLGEVDLLSVRTIDEAKHVPTIEGTIQSLKCAKMTANLVKDQKIDMLSTDAVKTEAAMEELETRAILDRVFELGDGDVVAGTVRAVEIGILDQPYSTSQRVKCAVIGVKDAQGAARYLDHGNLPFSKEILDFHKEKMAEREAVMGRRVGYDTVVKDITAIGMGSLLPARDD